VRLAIIADPADPTANLKLQNPHPFFHLSPEMSTHPIPTLDTFENPQPHRDYTIRMEVPEFTCLCPKTGQPDYATFHIEYVPDQLCLELKALKLYFWSFRDQGAFHEAVTNRVLDDLVAVAQPRFMRISGVFNVRGGIYTMIVVEHRQAEWRTPEVVSLPG
jgi:7-cyano-7-deazaguanine reductase